MSDAMRTAGDVEGPGGCGAALVMRGQEVEESVWLSGVEGKVGTEVMVVHVSFIDE